MKKIIYSFSILIAVIWLIAINFTYTPTVLAQENSFYRTKTIHSRDGIGKYYMGREIAQVMGHQGLLWLERPSRATEEKPQQLIEALSLQPDEVVADVGAGSGYISSRLAQVLPQGKVYAVDIQPEMLDYMEFIQQENGITNIETVLGQVDTPNLPPASIDLALMIDAYHEFEYPREMMQGIIKALKPQGRVVLVEYRQENPLIMIKPLHKMSQKQVKKEMAAVGLQWQKTLEVLPQQHIMIFSQSG